MRVEAIRQMSGAGIVPNSYGHLRGYDNDEAIMAIQGIKLNSPVCLQEDNAAHINKNITPTNGTPTNANPAQSISTLLSITNSQSNSAQFSDRSRIKNAICRFYKKVWSITRYNGAIRASIHKILI